MSDKQQYTQEDFKTMCKEDFSEVKKMLIDPESFNVTPEGIAGYCKLKSEECGSHFSQIIGEEFKIEIPDGAETATLNPGQVTVLQTKVMEDPTIAAGIMWFLFSNFSQPEEEGKVEKKEKTPKKESKVSKPREKTNWVAMAVPFKENTRQFVVFESLLVHLGTKEEFIATIPSLLEGKGLTPSKSVVSLLSTTLADAANRGWKVSFDKETKKYALAKE